VADLRHGHAIARMLNPWKKRRACASERAGGYVACKSAGMHHLRLLRAATLSVALAAAGCATMLGNHESSERVLSTARVPFRSHRYPERDRFVASASVPNRGEVAVDVERVQTCIVELGIEKTVEKTDQAHINRSALVGEIVVASVSGSIALATGISAQNACNARHADECDVSRALAIDFGILGGLFGVAAVADWANDGSKKTTTDKVPEHIDEKVFEDCGRERPANLPVSLSIAGQPKRTEKTDEQGRARFALSNALAATFDVPTGVTIDLPDGSSFAATIARAGR
jgi:hypothetical protein